MHKHTVDQLKAAAEAAAEAADEALFQRNLAFAQEVVRRVADTPTEDKAVWVVAIKALATALIGLVEGQSDKSLRREVAESLCNRLMQID